MVTGTRVLLFPKLNIEYRKVLRLNIITPSAQPSFELWSRQSIGIKSGFSRKQSIFRFYTNGYNNLLVQGFHIWAQSRSDWIQIRQIRDFLRFQYVLDQRDTDCHIWLKSVGPNLASVIWWIVFQVARTSKPWSSQTRRFWNLLSK